MADEAARLRATQSIVAEAETFKDLRDGLQDGVRAVVVNIQKFPSIQRLAVAAPVWSKMLWRHTKRRWRQTCKSTLILHGRRSSPTTRRVS